MSKLNEIEVEIKKRLVSYSEKTLGPDKKNLTTNLTKEIKSIIGGFGHELGYTVCASGFDNFESEWLYDIVWLEKNEKGLQSVKLIVESELSRGMSHLRRDFEKLLVSNAEMRIFICFNPNQGKTIEEFKNYSKTAVNNYNQLEKGSRVVVLFWDDHYSGDFIEHLIIK